MLPPAITLMGPTASGKTALAMALADNLPVEIISVDSALIYKGMDIGTAKPTPQELAAYPHHLVDILDPSQSYSAAEFCRDCLSLMQQISDRGKIPLLVGGTMMYFKALRDGMSDLPEADAKLRQEIEQQAQEHGWQFIHKQLEQVDPESAKRIHPNDPQRLQRALEVYQLTGKTMTEHRILEKSREHVLPYRLLQLAIAPTQRQVLHQRIEARFQKMLSEGFADEVKALIARGDLHADLPSIRSVGYRQMWQYLHGEYDESDMLHKGIVATRQLAKRQLTWLRGWEGVNWLYSEADADQTSAELVEQLLPESLKLIDIHSKLS